MSPLQADILSLVQFKSQRLDAFGFYALANFKHNFVLYEIGYFGSFLVVFRVYAKVLLSRASFSARQASLTFDDFSNWFTDCLSRLFWFSPTCFPE